MKINYPLLALTIDAPGIGTAEFPPMGLSSVIVRDVDVSTSAAGMSISAYTVGVMVDTPLMTLLLSHRTHRSALIFLMATFTLGNVPSTIAPDYTTPMLSRTLTSLNHGAFFGLGSVATANVVLKHGQASAVAAMFMGLALASIDDVPAATWLGETAGQRMSSLATAGPGVISMVSLFLSSPRGGIGAQLEVKKELAVLTRPQVLSALLATVLGAGAVSTLYTYISPILQSITHAILVFTMAMLVLIGIGFSIGNYFGDKLADRSVNGTLKGLLLLLMVIMLAVPFLARNELGAAISMVVWGAATFAVVPPLQMRVMRIASEVPGLPSSVSIGVFNLGNALGVAAGGAVASARLGHSFVPVMGAIVAGLALLLVFMSTRKQPEAVCIASS